MSNFSHKHSAHCESGVVSSLLRNNGCNISEAMCFGISSSLTFAYIPLLKINGMPLISFRMPPKSIIKGIQKNLGISFHVESFGEKEEAGMKRLDELLEQNTLVGIQTSVFFLPYFPPNMRFHFNAHNLLVFSKIDNNIYHVSDPVFNYTNKINYEDLKKARFAKGILAPKGILYTIKHIPQHIFIENAIKKSIKKTANMMLYTPLPFIGVKGIRFVARKIKNLNFNDEKNSRYSKLFMSHIVRMQEEIGTGGSGFRYMYASFLQEAASYTNKSLLQEASCLMSEIGDIWRHMAFLNARMLKEKDKIDLGKLFDLMESISHRETKVYKLLKRIN